MATIFWYLCIPEQKGSSVKIQLLNIFNHYQFTVWVGLTAKCYDRWP